MAGDDFLYVNVLGDRNLLRNIDQMPDTVRAIILAKVSYWTPKLAEAVRENIQSRLKRKTGKLLEGVDMEIIEDGVRVDGRVFIAGVPYAAAQEKGAITGAHTILPRNSKILAFIAATGDKVFATRVFHPGGVIPAHRFMKDAVRDMGPEISRGIKTAVVQGIRQKMRGGI